jgi:hypothetical protein
MAKPGAYGALPPLPTHLWPGDTPDPLVWGNRTGANVRCASHRSPGLSPWESSPAPGMHFKMGILPETFNLEERTTQAKLLKSLAFFCPAVAAGLPASKNQ